MYSSLKNIRKKKNYGLEILRMLMSFWIVLNHLYKPKNKRIKNIIIEHKFHVPTFLILSFYFLNSNLLLRNIKKIKERLERLLIPFIIYPTLTFIVYNFLYFFFDFKSLKTNLYQLIRQLIVGRGIYGILWFHFNLILITIYLYIISFIFKNNYLLLLQIIAIFSYLIQFSEYNYKFFIRYSDNIKYSVGYFAETIPLAVTGLSISYINILMKLEKKRFISIFFSILFLFIFFKYDIFTPVKGFGKQGIMYNFGGICFFLIFALIPIDNLNNKYIIVIKYITSYTPGIYFLHPKIYNIFKSKIFSIKHCTFSGCILIYLICYWISYIFSNIFKNKKIKYLFI